METNQKQNIIVISGPTASGKTSFSIEVAKKIKCQLNIDCEIINFDSVIFYKHLNIGAAKPTKEEMQNIKHHLIDIAELDEIVDAFKFSQMATTIIEQLVNNKKIPILVGGSGFYLRALIKGMYKGESTPLSIIEKSEEIYKEKGITPFIDLLKNVDPQSLNRLHPNDHYRLIRAAQYYWTTNRPISLEKISIEENNPYDLSIAKDSSWNILHIYLDIEKDKHLKIIEERTMKMINEGIIKEVEEILKQNYSSSEKSLRTIGYKETIQYLKGEIHSPQQLFEDIVIATRQLAKSQRTWFKKIVGKFKFNSLTERDLAIAKILEFLGHVPR